MLSIRSKGRTCFSWLWAPTLLYIAPPLVFFRCTSLAQTATIPLEGTLLRSSASTLESTQRQENMQTTFLFKVFQVQPCSYFGLIWPQSQLFSHLPTNVTILSQKKKKKKGILFTSPTLQTLQIKTLLHHISCSPERQKKNILMSPSRTCGQIAQGLQ